jgi:hypothetical protein
MLFILHKRKTKWRFFMRFRELLEEYDVPIAPEGHEHTTEGWIQFDCPFCDEGGHQYHMGFNIRGGFVNCWSCGAHSIASVIRAYTTLSFKAVKKICDEIIPEKETPIMRENIKGFLDTPPLGSLQDVHIRYLSGRGFDYHNIQKLWQIKATGVVGHLKWRIFIPITHRGKIVSWTTRALKKTAKKKYHSAKPEQELIPHKNLLYGSDYVRHTAIVVEGPLDVWAIGPGAVATFGTAFTPQQVISLLRVPRRVICYDNQPTAQKQATKLCDALGAFSGETINVKLDSKDPGEANIKELKKLRKFLK